MSEDILAVDDHPANLVAIEVALGDLAAGVVPAESGAEALRLLLERDFALILLDVRMPGLSGIETARLIRGRKRSQHIPIIFVTAHGRDDGEVREAYQLGAVDFLSKPIVPEVLRAKESVFVQLHRNNQEIAAQKTKLREMEHAQHLAAVLAESDRRKDEFLAMLGHELRNPLVPIAAGLELMRRKLPQLNRPDDALARARQAMERQTRHLTRLVDDLLDISRINSGKIELRRSAIDLRDVIEQALAMCRPTISEKRQTLEVSLPGGPVSAIGDGVRLTQVFANLLTNAARYTAEGGQIWLLCNEDGRSAEVRVTDTGRGINPDVLPRIFDMFVQERNGGGGLGLGLMLVKRLVELHGGTVDARSDGAGKGSEFIVRLPLVSPVPLTDAAMPVVVSCSKGDGPGSSRPLRLALVDDNADIRETMAELLSICGHEVALAEDGATGVELILNMRPDVALVDIGLPKLDGYQVAEKVRSSLGSQRLRMVAMTGFGQEEDRRRALGAGFDAHLVKPADLDDLLQILAPEPT